MKRIKRIIRTTGWALCCALILASCGSSKRASSSGRGGVRIPAESPGAAPVKSSYKEMRRRVEAMSFQYKDVEKLVHEAAKWIGTPYLYGGADRSGADCSGMVMRLFGDVMGVKLPRSSREQQKACQTLGKNDLRPGDLVFFATGRDRGRVSHVGLYIGDGQMIHASSSRGVITSGLSEAYYLKNYHSSGRPACLAEMYKKKKNKKKEKRVVEVIETEPAPLPAELDLDGEITQRVDSIFNFFE